MGVSLDDNLDKDSENYKESVYTIGNAMFQNVVRPYLKWMFNVPFFKFANSYKEALKTAHFFTDSAIIIYYQINFYLLRIFI